MYGVPTTGVYCTKGRADARARRKNWVGHAQKLGMEMSLQLISGIARGRSVDHRRSSNDKIRVDFAKILSRER